MKIEVLARGLIVHYDEMNETRVNAATTSVDASIPNGDFPRTGTSFSGRSSRDSFAGAGFEAGG